MRTGGGTEGPDRVPSCSLFLLVHATAAAALRDDFTPRDSEIESFGTAWALASGARSVDIATKPETAEAAARTARRATWPRRLRNGAVTLAVLVAVYALLGFLVLPLLAKP